MLNRNHATALATAGEMCLASASPCVVFTAPSLVAVASSPTYRRLDEGPLQERDDWPRVAAALRGVAHSGLPAEMELGGIRHPEQMVRLRCAPILGAFGTEGVFVWMNGPRLADDEVRQEAERTVSAKSRFLAAASHDLRQPFQAMRFFHSVLAGRLEDDPEGQRAAEMLGQAMESGEQLLNALLDISTLDAGTVVPRPDEFDLGELLERIAAEFRPQAEAKGLRLRLRIHSCRAKTDPVLVERIIRNLVANAIHYTRKGGILLALRRRGSQARIEVWDTGFGIPEEQLTTIFEEFHQLENPERDRSRGLGLGLAIVRRLARVLDLPVEVKSRLGRGSVFALAVPRVSASSGAGKESAAVTAMDEMGQRTVLVVEDDGMVLMGLTMILETWGMKVLAAEDMAQVLQRLDDGRPHLILSDLRLRAGLTGFDVVDRVRAILREPVPAVILTGETGKAELAEGRRRQLNFLHKPVQPDALRQTLADAMATVS